MTVATKLRAAAGAGFTPTIVAGLAAWYEAGDLTAADGTAVATWPDKSGNGRDATQADSGKRPLLKHAIVNGRSVLRFDGTDDYLRTAAFGVALAQPNSVLVVVKHANLTNHQCVFDGITAGARHVLYHDTSAANFSVYAGLASITQARDTNWNVRGGIFNGASSLALKNGTTASGNAGAHSLGGIGLGIFDDLTNPLFGDIAEVLVYDTALSTDDRQRLERWLGTKYGIAVL